MNFGNTNSLGILCDHVVLKIISERQQNLNFLGTE